MESYFYGPGIGKGMKL